MRYAPTVAARPGTIVGSPLAGSRFVSFMALVLLLAVACGEEEPNLGSPDKEVCLLRSDGSKYCIDTYEASRADATASGAGSDEMSKPRSLETRLPWARVTWAGAKAACELRGRRLCERDEWLDACDGVAGMGGSMFTYGSSVSADVCNTGGTGVEPGGTRAGCKSTSLVFDLNGNVREWTGNSRASAAARGGAYRSTATHNCLDGDTEQRTAPDATSEETGFRCCRDQ